MVGEVPKGVQNKPIPWHVWKTNHNGVVRYVVLLGEREMIIPGGSSACVLLFDGAAKRIKNWCFQTGWRINLDRALFDFSAELGSDVIILHMNRLINGRNVAKEYFAISADRLQFIRVENDKGEAVQNEYVFPNFEIGDVPPVDTEGEWIAMLRSAEKADILSALVFLGGRHVAEAQRHFVPEPKESKYANLFQQLISSPHIRELITHLTTSRNEWIKQAAVLADRGPADRFLQ